VKIPFIVKPILAALVIGGLFFFYNSFLVDRSLDSLKFSLSNVADAKSASTVTYVAPLMQSQLIDGLSTTGLKTEDMMRLQYGADVTGAGQMGRGVADVASMMKQMISEKEQQRNFILRFFDVVRDFFKRLFRRGITLGKSKGEDISPAVMEKIADYENKGLYDEAIKDYRDALAEYPDCTQVPTLMLRLGYLFHKLGDFKEAKAIYNKLIDQYPVAPETKIARGFVAKIDKRGTQEAEVKELLTKASKARDRNTKQKLYYDLGMIELSAVSLKKANKYFIKAASLSQDNDLTVQSYLRIGVCERLLGRLDESIETFKKLGQLAKTEDMKRQARYQLAQAYRQIGDVEKANETLGTMMEFERDKAIKSLLLFQKGSILLYDEKDIESAKDAFRELITKYSAQTMTSAGGKSNLVDFIARHVDLGILATRPKELEGLLRKTWLDVFLPKKVADAIDQKSKKFLGLMYEKSLRYEQFHVDAKTQSRYSTVTVDTKSINYFIEKNFPATGKVKMSNVSVKFDKDEKVTVFATFYLSATKTVRCFVTGEIKMVGKAGSGAYSISRATGGRKLVFIPKKCKIGKIPAPTEIIDFLLKPVSRNFNKYCPFELDKFNINKDSITLSGTLKEPFVKEVIEMEKKAKGGGRKRLKKYDLKEERAE